MSILFTVFLIFIYNIQSIDPANYNVCIYKCNNIIKFKKLNKIEKVWAQMGFYYDIWFTEQGASKSLKVQLSNIQYIHTTSQNFEHIAYVN